MKLLLLGLLAVNLLLVGWIVQLRFHPRAPVETATPAPRSSLVVTNLAPFHWRQLESPYYPVFIANLRSIGCPEQTIRDIITADLKGVYDARRAATNVLVLPDAEATKLRRALELEEQQAKQTLLGATTAATNSDSTSTPATRRAPEAMSHEELVAFFTRRDTPSSPGKLIYESLNPTDAELRELYDMSVKYDEQFGAGNPNSGNLKWEKQRRTALQQMEDQLRSLIGYPRFNEYLRESIIRQQATPQ